MSVMNMWTICDRCGWKKRRREVRREATGFLVCNACYDGAYDLVRHPQNRPFRVRRELLPVPDGRADVLLTIFGALEQGGFLLTEAGERIRFEDGEWTIGLSTYVPPDQT